MPRPRRRRWRRWVVLGFVVLVALVVLLPYAIALGPVRARIAGAVSDRLRGACTIDRLAFSWSSGVTAEGITIQNPPGFAPDRPCLRLRRMTADLALGSLLSGPVRMTALVDGLELYVEQAADGTTNLQGLARTDGGAPPSPTPPQEPVPPAEPGPGGASTDAVAFEFELRGATVEVRRDGRLVEALRDLSCRARSDAGQIVLDGAATLTAGEVAVDARVDPAAKTVKARLLSRGLDLARWQPLVDAFAPGRLTALAGRVDGELTADVAADRSEEHTSELQSH